MGQAPTPPEVVAKFRAEYLLRGNASAAARAVGIPERTGRGIASRLEEDETFVADRRRLNTRALDRLVTMRMRVAEVSAIRAEDAQEGELDKRPDYARIVLDAEKNAQHLARFDAERSDKATESSEKREPLTVIIKRDKPGESGGSG